MTPIVQCVDRVAVDPVGREDPEDPPYTPERRKVPRLPGPARVYLEMAQWLLAREMRESTAILTVPEAAERAFRKLLDHLARLITPSGCQALLLRALHLTQSDFRFLRATGPGLTTGAYFHALGKRAEGTDPEQVQRGLAALLGTLMELTALFVGDYLLGRLVLEVWPDMPIREPSHPS